MIEQTECPYQSAVARLRLAAETRKNDYANINRPTLTEHLDRDFFVKAMNMAADYLGELE